MITRTVIENTVTAISLGNANNMIKRFLIFMLTFNCFISDTDCSRVIDVAVFCSGNNAIAPHLKVIAYELGQYLGAHNFGLITGGGCLGLMKEIGDGYVSQARSLDNYQNIILQKYASDIHPAISEANIIRVKSLHDRLNYFYCTADIFIALPGGFGTLHELMDCLVHTKHMKKKIILLNSYGFWDHLIQQFNAITQSNPAAFENIDSLVVINTLSECEEFLCRQIF